MKIQIAINFISDLLNTFDNESLYVFEIIIIVTLFVIILKILIGILKSKNSNSKNASFVFIFKVILKSKSE